MNHAWIRTFALGVFCAICTLQQAYAQPAGPIDLRVEHLQEPLGIDSMSPRFSWQIADPTPGARQTAYEIQVASSPKLLAADKADLWNSGRISSNLSLGIRYAGAALKPSTRYYWRVKSWDAAGKSYAPSTIAFWETGLLEQSNWKAAWIGYETSEEAIVRSAPARWITTPFRKQLASEKLREERYAYRTKIVLETPIRHATLYATGQDTVAAWVNGAQVLSEQPLIPARQMPWKKFVRASLDGKLQTGSNTLAIEVLHYNENPSGMAAGDPPPLMATLIVEDTNGKWSAFVSDDGWKTILHAPQGWQKASFDDSGWQKAPLFEQKVLKETEPLGKPWIPGSIKRLERAFTLSAPVKSARIYATALGAYELTLNGKRVGKEIMAPGWTDYRDHLYSQTYDVTSLLSAGKNSLSALLAPGWYATPLEWFQQPNNYGLTPPALRLQMRIEHADGSIEWIGSDEHWQASVSTIQSAEIYDGESQDARIAPAALQPATVIHPAETKIEAQNFQPIRAERTLEAKSLTQPKSGVWIYDFGQNLAGVATLRIRGARGTDVRLRFAEILQPDGTLYTDNLRTAKATDHFILAGKGEEEFTPHFTFHGFRYVELTGIQQKPAQNAVIVNVLHTDAPITVKLSTGSAMLNQLWSNILWGQRSNFVGLPTDCPQRDERLGWTADAQVFWRAASYNMDLAAFSRKFSADLRSTQAGTPFYGIFAPGTVTPVSGSGAGWSDAGVIVPWTSWLQTGNTSIIDENWAAMESYLNAILAANPDFLWTKNSGTHFGDWLAPEGKTDYTLIATAYWAYDVDLMRQMARATKRYEAERSYAALFEKIRAAFEKKFVRGDGFVAGADNSEQEMILSNPGAKSAGGDTQTGYVLALHMNLLPEFLRPAAAKLLADKIHANHDLLGTGFLGTPYLLEELTKSGYQKLAYTLLLNTRYPSWGYMVDHGATTMWERWNGDQMIGAPAMNSFNHYAYGAVADWIYRYAAGIDASADAPGFRTVVLHPHFDARIAPLAFDYDSPMGAIHSAWSLSGANVRWELTLPANTVGWLPLSAEEAAHYTLDGKPLSQSPRTMETKRNSVSGFELKSGHYLFEISSKTGADAK